MITIGRYFCTEMVNRGVEVLALGRSKKDVVEALYAASICMVIRFKI